MPPVCIVVGLAAPMSAFPVWIAVIPAALCAGLLGWRLRGYRRDPRHMHLQVLERALHGSSGQLWTYDLARGRLWLYAEADPGQSRRPLELDKTELLARLHPDDLPGLRRHIRACRAGDAEHFRAEQRADLQLAGHCTWLDIHARVVERDAAGAPMHLAGIARPFASARLAGSEPDIAAEILQRMHEAVAVLDQQLRFVSINAAFTHITGHNEAQALGQTLQLLDRPTDTRRTEHMLAAIERDGHWEGEAWKVRRDGEEILCSLRHNRVRDTSGQRDLHVLVMEDITARRRTEQELNYLTRYDTLTGLPNRALLSERLEQAIAHARTRDERVAVLFLDLDHFKDINDSMGHAAGDRVLRLSADRIRLAIGSKHTAARLSGDEFSVVLDSLSDIGEAEQAARQLLAGFEVPLQLDENREVAISPSIGISLFPDHSEQPGELLKFADTAMYRAKATGRRTYKLYSPQMDEGTRQRALLANALRRLRIEDELRLVYQPRYSLHEHRIVGFEALMRWDSPEFGSVSPDRFIPLAEETGLIVAFGEWALQQACRRLQLWAQRGIDNITVSVNVSAIQLNHGNLPETLARILHETGVAPERIELELTESAVMSDVLGHAEVLHALRRLGVGLAIDDFGTGYSSLAYLKRLPIDTLKIDQEFIADLTRNSDDQAITSTIIAMARSLSLKVVAEGVEDAHQVEFLRRHGCDEIQGYLVSPALEPEACEILLRRMPMADQAEPIPS
jgi:diguanylate cyclase (GGDEF)-like protein/PAS domain S-box-containing protein